jgi:hypothetical protein
MTGQALEFDLLIRVLAQTRRHEPQAIAVLINGSYARGSAAATSDLDLHVITPSPLVARRTWFEPRRGQPPLHISLATGTAEQWMTDGGEPVDWSLGFPAVNAAIYLWAENATREYLGADPSQRHPAGPPQLEEFIEWVMKAKRASAARDEPGLRWAAQHAGRLAPRLLLDLNPPRLVYDPRDALEAAVSLSVAPVGFGDQLLVCLGLTPVPAARITQNVLTMAFNLLAYLREYAPNTDGQPHLAAYLRFGLLERHLMN